MLVSLGQEMRMPMCSFTKYNVRRIALPFRSFTGTARYLLALSWPFETVARPLKTRSAKRWEDMVALAVFDKSLIVALFRPICIG